MPIEWERDPGEVYAELAAAYADLIIRMVAEVCNRWVPEIESWMKDNAPWTDRTSNARQTLWADVEQIARTAFVVIISHGVSYGEYLEFAHGGNYAIVAPALDHFAPLIWRDIRQRLGV